MTDKEFWDISFQENQTALAAHHQQDTDLPDPAIIAISNVLEPLGFSYSGEFDPIEFDLEDYDWIEIGVYAIASNSDWIGVLSYSLMEYWSCSNFVSTQFKLEITKKVHQLNDQIHTA